MWIVSHKIFGIATNNSLDTMISINSAKLFADMGPVNLLINKIYIGIGMPIKGVILINICHFV